MTRRHRSGRRGVRPAADPREVTAPAPSKPSSYAPSPAGYDRVSRASATCGARARRTTVGCESRRRANRSARRRPVLATSARSRRRPAVVQIARMTIGSRSAARSNLRRTVRGPRAPQARRSDTSANPRGVRRREGGNGRALQRQLFLHAVSNPSGRFVCCEIRSTAIGLMVGRLVSRTLSSGPRLSTGARGVRRAGTATCLRSSSLGPLARRGPSAATLPARALCSAR